MPSKRVNINSPGDAHELTFSTYRRIKMLTTDMVRRWFLEELDKARRKHQFEVWAFVIMPEYIHVLVWPKNEVYDIALIRNAIKSPFARRALAHLRRTKPEFLKRLTHISPSGRTVVRFWQPGGGYDRNLFSPKAVNSAIQYIHVNPVRRGLVGSELDWPWSSARWYAGLDSSFEVDQCLVVRSL